MKRPPRSAATSAGAFRSRRGARALCRGTRTRSPRASTGTKDDSSKARMRIRAEHASSRSQSAGWRETRRSPVALQERAQLSSKSCANCNDARCSYTARATKKSCRAPTPIEKGRAKIPQPPPRTWIGRGSSLSSAFNVSPARRLQAPLEPPSRPAWPSRRTA